MLQQHIWFSLAWVAYCILHSALAAPSVKRRLQLRMGPSFRYYRLLYSMLALLLLIPLLWWQVTMRTEKLWTPGIPALTLGFVLIIPGAAGMMISLSKYVVSRRGFRGLFIEGNDQALQVSGLHRLVRHPLYLSTFLLLGGVFLCLPYLSLFLVLAIIITYTIMAIPLEEKKLIELFGDNYLNYRKKVPAIFPRWRKAGE